MKKILNYLLFILCGSGLMISCSNNQSSSELFYNISYQESEFYIIDNLPQSAKSGEVIYFDVELQSVFYEIESVYSDETNITYSTLGYKFVMPSKDITIKVDLKDIGEFNDDNDHLDWGSSVNGFLSCASEDDKNASWDVTQDLNLSFPGISSSNYITSIKSTIYSSNQQVIPNDAIEFIATTSSSSNIIIGGKLRIDIKKIGVGETYIYVNLKPNNSSLGTLIKKFNVVEYGQIELDSIDATLLFDNNTNYDANDLFINIRDMQYVYGCNTLMTQTIYLKDLSNLKYDFKYYIGHTYFISCGILDGTGNSLIINDWVGSGDSTSGFNQIIDGVLNIFSENIEVIIEISD